MHKHAGVLAVWGIVFAAMTATAQLYPELNPILSRLQALSHNVHAQAEWTQTLNALDEVAEKALRDGHMDLVVQARAVKAMALADMKKDLRGAIQVLEEAQRRFGQQKAPSVKRLFIQQAEYYSRLGDADSVRRVIDEFRRNPNFDPAHYPVELYEGRNTPMIVVRPNARGEDSISVTAMEVARERARLSPGNLFPDAQWTDSNGRAISMQALRGKVVLVDFWHPAWTPWRSDLDNLRRAYALYHRLGFEIVGLSLDRDVHAARTFAGQQRMVWPLVFGDSQWSRQLNVFGEASNFLVDPNGVIVARDVRGAELTQALQRLLGAP